MIAREYLKQLKVLDARIDNRIRQLNELKELTLATGGFDYSKERVISSPAQDTIADRVSQYVDLEIEINSDIDRYIDLKHKIIEQINALDDALHIKILNMYYAENVALTTIAETLSYSYAHIARSHIEALEAFEEKYHVDLQVWAEDDKQ